jgi:hypothetical protein
MNKILLATATFALVAAAAPLCAQQATTKDQLIGRSSASKPQLAIKSAIPLGSM